MKTAILALLVLTAGCGTPSSDNHRPHMLISADPSIGDSAALAGCKVWADYMDCEIAAPGVATTVIVPGAVMGAQDAYGVTEGTHVTIDVAASSAAGLDLAFVLAHEFGHRMGIISHLPEPAALMSATAAGTWKRAELSQADRDAAELLAMLRGANLPIVPN